MSIQKRIAKGAIAAGLSAAMLFGGAAMPVSAFAAEQNQAGTGTVVIDDTNANAAYKVYQLFIADVNTDVDGNDTVLRVENSGYAALDNAVQSFLDGYTVPAAELSAGGKTFQQWLMDKYGVTNAADLAQFAVAGKQPNQIPQNKAEYIGFMIEKSTNAVMFSQTDPVTKQGASFADRLADVVKANGASPISANGGEPFSATSEGYFLIISDQATVDNDEAGTAVIWTTLSEQDKEITPKTSIPTLIKQVKDDSADSNDVWGALDSAEGWGEIADANTGEDVSFKIETTLPANYDAYDEYYLQIRDTIPAHMALKGDRVEDNVHVFIINSSERTPNADVTSYLIPHTPDSLLGSIVYSKTDGAEGSLTVTIPNLKEQFGGNVVAPDSKVIVTYDAHLTAGAGLGTDYNTNTAQMEYSADPVDLNFKKLTSPDTANVTAYELDLNKVDKATRLALDGAKFTIKTEIGGNTYYIGEHGELQSVAAASAFQFETVDGKFSVAGLDEGTYVLEEVQTPTDGDSEYEEIDEPVTIVIDAKKDYAEGTLEGLTSTYAGGEHGAPLPTVGNLATKDEDGIVQSTPSTGVVEFNVSNDRVLVMPLTGLPVKETALYGSAVLAGLSLIVLIRNKRKDAEASEDFEVVE